MTTVTMTSSDAPTAQFANSTVRLVSNKQAVINVQQEEITESGDTELLSCFAILVEADDGGLQTVRLPANTLISVNSTITITKL